MSIKVEKTRTQMKVIALNKSTGWLLACIFGYFVMNGAQLWETVLMVPAWTAAPPASLHFIQPPHGLDFKVFWICLHSVHEVIFVMALVLNWKIPARRNPLIWIFMGHIAVRAWTILYFAPTLMWFQDLPVSDSVDQLLVEKAALWRNLNYVRVGLFFALNIAMIWLIKQPGKVKND